MSFLDRQQEVANATLFTLFYFLCFLLLYTDLSHFDFFCNCCQLKALYFLLNCNALFLHMICKHMFALGGSELCDILFWGLEFMTKRDRGGGKKFQI